MPGDSDVDGDTMDIVVALLFDMDNVLAAADTEVRWTDDCIGAVRWNDYLDTPFDDCSKIQHRQN